MGNNEFDKIVISVALAIFVLIFSSNLGGFLYRTKEIPDKKGFIIEITEGSGESSVSTELPELIQIGKIMQAANAEAGKAIFNKCAVCHTIGKGEPNKVGPNLWGIVGAVTARHQGDFKYSEAMLKRAVDKAQWNYETLYRYLYSPKKYIPGTKMAFAGIKKDDERANLIAYLRTLADNPLPLPQLEK